VFKRILRYFKRALIILVAGGALSFLILLIAYGSWRGRIATQLESGSQLAETMKGTIEFVVTGEQDSPASRLLVLHGSPGGYDAGKIMVDWINVDANTQCIIPSRPGYLRTPLEVGVLPAEAADSMIALLDHLEIDKVTVMGWSGGGPTAVEIAKRHPSRVDGLILLSARIRGDDKYYFESKGEAATPFNPESVHNSPHFFGPDFSSYAKICGFNMMPNSFLQTFFPKEIKSMDLTIERLRQLSKTTQPPSRRQMGQQNDIWQFASLERNPEFPITTPTLIIHSRIDDDVDFEHAEYIHQAIDDSELFVVEGESHFSTLNQAAADKIKSFVKQLTKTEPPK